MRPITMLLLLLNLLTWAVLYQLHASPPPAPVMAPMTFML